MEKGEELYSGKAKSVYKTADPDKLVLFFRNDTSAFDGEKIEQLESELKRIDEKEFEELQAKIQEAEEEGYDVVIKGREAHGFFGKYVYMPDKMGYGLTLAIILLAMGTWYSVVTWNEWL